MNPGEVEVRFSPIDATAIRFGRTHSPRAEEEEEAPGYARFHGSPRPSSPGSERGSPINVATQRHPQGPTPQQAPRRYPMEAQLVDLMDVQQEHTEQVPAEVTRNAMQQTRITAPAPEAHTERLPAGVTRNAVLQSRVMAPAPVRPGQLTSPSIVEALQQQLQREQMTRDDLMRTAEERHRLLMVREAELSRKDQELEHLRMDQSRRLLASMNRARTPENDRQALVMRHSSVKKESPTRGDPRLSFLKSSREVERPTRRSSAAQSQSASFVKGILEDVRLEDDTRHAIDIEDVEAEWEVYNSPEARAVRRSTKYRSVNQEFTWSGGEGFHEFWQNLMAFQRINELNNTETKWYLAAHLKEGPARKLMTRLANAGHLRSLTLEEVRMALEAENEPVRPYLERLRREYRTREFEPNGEDMMDFANWFEDSARAGKVGEDSWLEEFAAKLPQPLRGRILDQSPETWGEMKRVAVTVHRNHLEPTEEADIARRRTAHVHAMSTTPQTGYYQRPPSTSHQPYGSPTRQAPSSTSPAPQGTADPTTGLQKLQSTMEGLMEVFLSTARQDRPSGGRGRGDGGGFRRGGFRDRPPGVCWNCRQAGHNSRECVNPRVGDEGANQGQGRGGARQDVRDPREQQQDLGNGRGQGQRPPAQAQ